MMEERRTERRRDREKDKVIAGDGVGEWWRRVRKTKGGMLCVPWCEGGAINTAGTPPEAGFIQQLSFHRFS